MVQMVRAPSVLGLGPTGVERLADALLGHGLDAYVTAHTPLLEVEDLNHLHDPRREESGVLNAAALREHAGHLKEVVGDVVRRGEFPVVLGGDCSILVGIMAALKARGTYGLAIFDAHADFYLPSQSLTGQATDMDVALLTGHGPRLLTDIDGLGPYAREAHVLHVGQRDQEETVRYGSSQISGTEIVRHDLATIRRRGIGPTAAAISARLRRAPVRGTWLHLDADVLDDRENPAVDYRLPGGLRFRECERLMGAATASGGVVGMSVAIYNPRLDPGGHVGTRLAGMIARLLAAGAPVLSRNRSTVPGARP